MSSSEKPPRTFTRSGSVRRSMVCATLFSATGSPKVYVSTVASTAAPQLASHCWITTPCCLISISERTGSAAPCAHQPSSQAASTVLGLMPARNRLDLAVIHHDGAEDAGAMSRAQDEHRHVAVLMELGHVAGGKDRDSDGLASRDLIQFGIAQAHGLRWRRIGVVAWGGLLRE